jgi:hypothetical protein
MKMKATIMAKMAWQKKIISNVVEGEKASAAKINNEMAASA